MATLRSRWGNPAGQASLRSLSELLRRLPQGRWRPALREPPWGHVPHARGAGEHDVEMQQSSSFDIL
eukprot:6321357-Pyramimonas_sp.AAC.1